MARIGIIGCGWLGRPLALELKKTHQVTCYSRKTPTDSLLDYSINPDPENPFWENEIFIIAISTRDHYLETLSRISRDASAEASVILFSSTSVYKEFDTEVDEDAAITHKTLQKEAEELVLALRQKVLILRLGGLMGDDRIAGRWKSVSDFTDGAVNYLHRDDAIAIVQKMIEADIDSGIFNLVSPEHPLRSEVHQTNSLKYGFELGTFTGMSRRTVSPDKLIKLLDYSFIHPDPLHFWEN